MRCIAGDDGRLNEHDEHNIKVLNIHPQTGGALC